MSVSALRRTKQKKGLLCRLKLKRVEMNTSLMLAGVSGICWTIVYIECIRMGIKHKTYAMPFWALALNIAWESVHTFFGWRGGDLSVQVVFNAVWCLLDIGILITYFNYGRKYFPDFLSKNVFIAWSVLVLLMSFILQYFFVNEFGLVIGGAYAAFLQNLLMSVLFMGMFMQRKGCEGQNLTIAISKFLGTLAPTILVGLIGIKAFGKPNLFILVLGLMIAVVDLIYIGLVMQNRRTVGQG